MVPDDASRPGGDPLTRFLLPAAGVRGVHVRLDATWREVRGHDPQPDAIGELLGESLTAAALLTGHTKVDGRLSLQIRAGGPLRSLFAECTAAGTLRGIARAQGDGPFARNLGALAPGGTLAITIENPGAGGREPVRYQGLVALEADSLAGALEEYFRRSEQLPTRLLLAADASRAAGLMLQALPGDGRDSDGWNRAGALFDTLGQEELLACPSDALLHRLFHEEGAEVLGTRTLRFGCSCSRERVEAMLQSLGRDEAMAAAEGGEAEVRCEFCGRQYRFPDSEVAALFERPEGTNPAPERLQ